MNSNTLLHRQINPAWMQAGDVTSQAFKPTSKDEGFLSVYDGSKITAEDAWKHYTGTPRCFSIGVLAVSCGDCADQGLQVIPDPAPHYAHAVIDFTRCTVNKTKKKAKLLKEAAMKRGWQYQADVTP